MALPRVFVSSTYYDLKYIRENLKYFISTLGFDPVLSEEGDITYNPDAHTMEACLDEVCNCQLFVLIIGGRHGENYKDTGKSIVNHEYQKAVQSKIPVFALVDQGVLAEHRVYSANKKRDGFDAESVQYPSVDDTKLFAFIDDVRGQTKNNALQAFRNFDDIQEYLRKQWAGMMFDFLKRKNEFESVADTLQELKRMGERIEHLGSLILDNVGEDIDKADAEIHHLINNSLLGRCLLRPPDHRVCFITPKILIREREFGEGLSVASCHTVHDDRDENNRYVDIMGTWGYLRFSPDFYEGLFTEYETVRNKVFKILRKHRITSEAYVDWCDAREGANIES